MSMTFSDQTKRTITVVIVTAIATAALVLLAFNSIVSSNRTTYESKVTLSDDRQVTCVQTNNGISCDWASSQPGYVKGLEDQVTALKDQNDTLNKLIQTLEQK